MPIVIRMKSVSVRHCRAREIFFAIGSVPRSQIRKMVLVKIGHTVVLTEILQLLNKVAKHIISCSVVIFFGNWRHDSEWNIRKRIE